ncbi:hypothetical protein Acr_16g0000870 [Actinidia rufa]|uniref:Reverse transcriptase Ty1/copia-type domain-containing protein n=1 Tax=Actinidia rufa TaxID=165716 RepID=A0A7J0FXQ5_9ERIC|nr:hypothetical protein Acr_16g0000870 [Actinidia rufa]
MALPPDYEHIRASLLHRHPLPIVGQALAELRSEETRKKIMVYQHSQPILATPVWAPLQPPSQSVWVPSPKNMPSGSQKKYCSFCRRDTHFYEDCRSRSKPKRKGYHNRQTAAITDSSGPSPDSSSSTLIVVDVETIVTQVLSRTNLHSSALSTTSADGSLMTTTHTGTISTPDLTIDHTYLVPALSHNLLSVGQLYCRSRSKPKRKGYHNRQTAAITDSFGPSLDSSSSTLTVADVETIVTQVLSRTNLHSSALSTTSADGSLMTTTHTGTISTPDLTIDHTYLDPRTGKTIGTGRKVGHLFELESLHALHRSIAAASSSSSPPSSNLPSRIMDVPDVSPLAAPLSVPCPPIHCSTRRAMKDELDALDKTHTWDLVDLQFGKSTMGCKWVYKIKTQADGTVDSSTISQLGFSSSTYDSAPFLKKSIKGTVLLLLYVDDMIITGDDLDENNVRLNTSDGEPLSDPTLYRQLVGSLIYLTVTRLDISHVVHIVSQFMFAPRSTHYAAALRILRYVKGTIFHGLHFSSQSSLILRAYSDVDWAGDLTIRRSTTGYCFFLADATSELLWLRWLIQDLGIDSPSVALHCDNHSAIQIAHNDALRNMFKRKVNVLELKFREKDVDGVRKFPYPNHQDNGKNVSMLIHISFTDEDNKLQIEFTEHYEDEGWSYGVNMISFFDE